VARVWLFPANIDTDQIVPGRYAPYMTSEAELGKYPFIEYRPEFAKQVQRGDIIVAGSNFGCGSSREYAPRALVAVGIAAIIAPSFSRIFFRNALNLGLPLFECDLQNQLRDGQLMELDMTAFRISLSDGQTIVLPTPPAWLKETWAEGGILQYFRHYGRLPLGENG
jgi:methanogen homoaconitase small subunit